MTVNSHELTCFLRARRIMPAAIWGFLSRVGFSMIISYTDLVEINEKIKRNIKIH